MLINRNKHSERSPERTSPARINCVVQDGDGTRDFALSYFLQTANEALSC